MLSHQSKGTRKSLRIKKGLIPLDNLINHVPKITTKLSFTSLLRRNYDQLIHISGPRNPRIDMAMGSPTNPSFIPLELFDFSQQMTFMQRLKNTLARLIY